jgi:8-oxo-dGTP diphosphatase
MVCTRTDECEHPRAIGNRDGAETELLEDLVGNGSRRRLGEATTKLRQGRFEELQDGGFASQPAHPRHDRIVHVTEAVLAELRKTFGDPVPLEWSGEVSTAEMALARGRPGSTRRHDATLFVFNGDRLALIRKPSYPPEVWRPPGGGVLAGEDFVEGAAREALEETGLRIELARYLVATRARFTCGSDSLDWQTHVFSARTSDERLDPLDAEEIEAARWGTLTELDGPIRARLLATGRALWRYRVALHDAAGEALR